MSCHGSPKKGCRADHFGASWIFPEDWAHRGVWKSPRNRHPLAYAGERVLIMLFASYIIQPAIRLCDVSHLIITCQCEKSRYTIPKLNRAA